MSDERRAYIAQNYGQMLNTEIAEMIGCSPSNVSKYLAAMNLTRSAEDLAKLRDRAIARWRERCQANGSHERRSMKLRRVYKMERLNMLSGMPKRTNMRVNILPSRIRRAEYRMNFKLKHNL